MPDTRPPYVRFLVALRALIVLCALLTTTALAGWMWVKDNVHEEMRKLVLGKFSEHYANYEVSLGSARFHEQK